MDLNVPCLWLGRALVLYVVFKLLKGLHYIWTLYIFPTNIIDFSKYGKWTVVTGCTEGIGKAMAFEFASRGQNILMLSLYENDLKRVSKEISSKHGVKTRYLQVDFSDDEHIYKEIEEFLQGYDIGVLVNNVGIVHPPVNFLDIPNLSKSITGITRINMLSVFKMHQIVLPGMVKKKKGIILNLSSASCLIPLTNMSMYGASKSFVNYFSQALSYEYEDKGIIIQSIRPLFIKTDMTKDMLTWNSLPTPESLVKSTLNTIGKERAVIGSASQTRQAKIIESVPLSWTHRYISKKAEEARKAAQKKN